MFTSSETANNYLNTGKSKAAMPVWKMLLMGFLAGAFIAFAGVGATFGNVYVNKVMGAAIFPAGLAMVIVAGSELFTGNCLLIMPVLTGDIKVTGMLKNWLFVYAGNFAGGLAVSALTVLSGTFSSEAVKEALINTAKAKVSMEFGSAFVKGILCNILVCIAVWMAMYAKDVAGKIIGLYFPIFLFVICGFEHSVANMFYVPSGIMLHAEGVTWELFFVRNLIPVTLGNIVGGCFVGTVYRFLFLPGKKA